MNKKSTIAALITSLILIPGALGFVIYQQYSENENLISANDTLVGENKRLLENLSTIKVEYKDIQLIKSQLTYEAIKVIRLIDNYDALLQNDSFGAVQPILPLKDELNSQKNALYLFIEDNNTRELDEKAIKLAQNRMEAVTQFIKVATTLRSETSLLLPPDTITPGGDAKNGLDPSSKKIRGYRWDMYVTVLAPVLEKLKEDTGSQKLPYCQNLTQAAKNFDESVSTITKNMESLDKAILDKMWLTPIGRMIIKDSYDANLKAFGTQVTQSMVAKATTSDYVIGIPCNFFSSQMESNARLNASLVTSINEVEAIEPKVSEALRPYCKLSTEDICKAAISELATTVAIQSATYPFSQMRLENRIESTLINFIKAKEAQKAQLPQQNMPLMDRKDINSTPQKFN